MPYGGNILLIMIRKLVLYFTNGSICLYNLIEYTVSGNTLRHNFRYEFTKWADYKKLNEGY